MHRKNQHHWLLMALIGLLLVIALLIIWKPFSHHQDATTHAQNHQYVTTQTSKISNYMQQQHFLGTVYAVKKQQKIVVSNGYINRSFEMSNNENQPFPLYSITKFLTAIMIQQLIQQGRLSMDTTLDHFYPQVPSANTITIRQLLDHNSGITMDETPPDHVLNTDNDSIQYTLQHMQVNNNHGWQYTGANYTILAGVLDKITNNTYANNFKQQIVTPLNLKHTFAWVPNNNQIVQSYNFNNGDYAATNNFDNNLISSELGCGNVFSSPADLAKIIQSVSNGKLMSHKQFISLSNSFKSNPAGQHYSAGLYHQNGKAFAYGSDNGFQSAIQFNLKNNNLVVININQGSFNSAKALVNIVNP